MKTRNARREDIDEMMKIVEALSPKHPYNSVVEDEINKSFEDYGYKPTYLIVEENEKIFGFLGYSQSRINYRVYEIFHVMVNPQHQKKGFGTKLMEKAINEIKSLRRESKDDYLILTTSLQPEYFERFGFNTLIKIKVNGSCLMSLSV